MKHITGGIEMKFDAFIEKAQAEIEAKNEYDLQLQTKCSALQRTRDEMGDALKAGKMTLFTELTQKSTAQEAALKQFNENPPKMSTTAGGIVSAWNKHIEAHNKDFTEKLEAFRAARRALCEMYKELIEMQRNVLTLREQTAKLVGEYDPANPGLASPRTLDGSFINTEAAYSAFGLAAPAAMKTGNRNIVVKCNEIPTPPEAAYFIARGDLPKEMLCGLVRIQENFSPCSKLELEDSGRYRFM
jgi:hypothetical protein